MDPSRENSISVLDRDLLLVDVGGGAETHLAAVAQEEGRSADHQGNDPTPADGRWERTTLCGRTWNRMAAGADELLPLWRDPALAPTCRSCLRTVDTWFPAADTPAGVHLLAAVVAEEVIRFSSAYITSVPVEHVEAVRRAVRRQNRRIFAFGDFRRRLSQIASLIEIVLVDRRPAAQSIPPKRKIYGFENRGLAGVVVADEDGVIGQNQLG